LLIQSSYKFHHYYFILLQTNMSASGYIPSFKERKNLAERIRMVEDIKRQQPDKIPIIIERYEGERYLPLLDKCKYLVPNHITVAELMQIVRRRLQLHPDQAFFLLLNEKSIVSNSMTISQLYQMEQEQDGFLYMVYASQPTFG
jgi:microtubule-associated protein 1 light chain